MKFQPFKLIHRTYGECYLTRISKNLATRFRARWTTKDGETLNVAGVIKRLGGDMFGISDVQVTLLGGKPAHRALDGSVFTALSQRGVVEKLNKYLSKVSVTHDVDPLKLEMEKDRRERNRETSYTEGSVKREAAPEPAEKLVFGLKVGDPALGKIFEAACSVWVRQHSSEFDGTGMTDGQRALAVENMNANIRSMARLLERWALGGQIKACTAQEVQDARVWLEQRGFWKPIRRQRGQSAGREYFPAPEAAPEPAEVDPRKLSFAELSGSKRSVSVRRGPRRACAMT